MATAVQENEIPDLYHHQRLGAYECIYCTELIEIPKKGWLMVNGSKALVEIARSLKTCCYGWK